MSQDGIKIYGLIGLFALVFLVVFLALPPIPQDPGYHTFADQNEWLNIPNTLNVLSNLPFFLVGYLGFMFAWKNRANGAKFIDPLEAQAFLVAFAGIFLVGLGSGFYHWMPKDWTLIPDRLPMTIGFMGILAIFVSERINVRAGVQLLPVFIFIGLFSVAFWGFTELDKGLIGDLRLYGLVQFFPIVVILLLIFWYKPCYTATHHLIWILVFYVLAKAAEHYDCEIWKVFDPVISGHTLKHLLAALATYYLYLYLKDRTPVKS